MTNKPTDDYQDDFEQRQDYADDAAPQEPVTGNGEENLSEQDSWARDVEQGLADHELADPADEVDEYIDDAADADAPPAKSWSRFIMPAGFGVVAIVGGSLIWFNVVQPMMGGAVPEDPSLAQVVGTVPEAAIKQAQPLNIPEAPLAVGDSNSAASLTDLQALRAPSAESAAEAPPADAPTLDANFSSLPSAAGELPKATNDAALAVAPSAPFVPADTKSTEAPNTETQPKETQATETQPKENQATETQQSENQSGQTQAAEAPADIVAPNMAAIAAAEQAAKQAAAPVAAPAEAAPAPTAPAPTAAAAVAPAAAAGALANEALEGRFAELEGKLNDRSTQVGRLEKRLTEALDQLNALQSQNKVLQDQNTDLQKQLTQITSDKQDAPDVAPQVTRLSQELSAVRTQIRTLEQQADAPANAATDVKTQASNEPKAALETVTPKADDGAVNTQQKTAQSAAQPAAKPALKPVREFTQAEQKIHDRAMAKATPVGRDTQRTSSRKPPAKVEWSLRSVTRSTAFVAPANQPSQLRRVQIGDVLEGVGTVQAITQQDGRWVVIGSEGTVK